MTLVQVRGAITIKPRPPAKPETVRLGCGVDSNARRALSFNISGTGGSRSRVSLTLEGLTVEGVILRLRDGHVAVVEATLLDVALISAETDHVAIDVINSTWTRRYPNLTTCEVGVSAGDDFDGWGLSPNQTYFSTAVRYNTLEDIRYRIILIC